jgi:hypothetical protein
MKVREEQKRLAGPLRLGSSSSRIDSSCMRDNVTNCVSCMWLVVTEFAGPGLAEIRARDS